MDGHVLEALLGRMDCKRMSGRASSTPALAQDANKEDSKGMEVKKVDALKVSARDVASTDDWSVCDPRSMRLRRNPAHEARGGKSTCR